MVPVSEPEQFGVPPLLIGLAAAVVLGGLDLVGAWLAKEWALGSHPVLTWVLGAATFVGLFALYASSLQYAEMTTVTLVWIVVVQVGVMLLDRFRYGVDIDPIKWVLAAAVVGLLAVMLILPDRPRKEVDAAPVPVADMIVGKGV